jgi:hypothetical protein
MLPSLKRESKRFWPKMSLKETYAIQPISYKEAMDIVVEKHYLHRKCPVSRAYGLVDITTDEVVGVVTYGVSPSSTLLKGICGPEEAHNVYELNRLWVDDMVAKNGESYLVANSMKLLDREIIVSFADTSQGHVGYIYQAANFIYTGLSAKFKDPKVVGKENMHHATYANGLTNAQVVEKFGAENVTFVERPRKHRYIYFNCDKRRKKELLKKLRYKTMPYPKLALV